MYKVKHSDLIGEVKDFPIEVVQKMVERQVEQGNKENVTSFQICAIEDWHGGGFEWKNTKEGQSFWYEILIEKHFDFFFKKYPKADARVYYRGVLDRGEDIIAELEKLGGVNRFDYDGSSDNRLYFISPITRAIGYFIDGIPCSELLKDAYTEIFLPEKVDLLR